MNTDRISQFEALKGTELCLKTGFDEHSKCWHVNEAFEPLQKEQAECLINAGPPTHATGSALEINTRQLVAIVDTSFHQDNGSLIRTMIATARLSLSPLAAEASRSYHFN